MVPIVNRRYVRGYEAFVEFMNNHYEHMNDCKNDTSPYILFTGTKLPDTGKSWCPDCVAAEPFIEDTFAEASQFTTLIIVEVGDRSYWKDPNCPFRTNPCSKLKVLPTLVKYKTQKRLEGDQLLNPELIEMLLSDADD